MDSKLSPLLERYGLGLNADELRTKVRDIYVKYVRRQQEAILDAAATAAGLSIEMLRDMDDPQVLEAVSLQYPNLDIDDLSSYAEEQLGGITQGVKGKYFEVLLRDRLNAGEWIGDLHLSEGQVAHLAVTSRQPGWDLQILDHDGHVVEHLQAKATSYAQYVKEALEENPDIQVITTQEVAEELGEQVIDSGISDTVLERTTERAVEELSETAFADFLDHFNPLLPIGIITLAEGRKALVGKATWARVWDSWTRRVSRSSVALGVGALAAVFGMGVFSVPVSFFTRQAWERFDKTSVTLRNVQIHTSTLRDILHAQEAARHRATT